MIVQNLSPRPPTSEELIISIQYTIHLFIANFLTTIGNINVITILNFETMIVKLYYQDSSLIFIGK